MASLILIGDNATQLSNLTDAVSTADSEYIILADAAAPLEQASIDKLQAACSQEAIAAISINGEITSSEISGLDAEAILNAIISRNALPLTAAAAKKDSLLKALSGYENSFAEAMLQVAIHAVTTGKTLNIADHIDRSAEASMDDAAFSRCLSSLVNSATIEELFTEHAWAEHSEESAAAAYHTLAAYFIRFGDYASAGECIKLSDQFEESPRSLALKALIAFNKGETLGAVANLVSSLQQYEERKKSTTHYIKFSPSNIELINSSLASGLDALNKRDNERALDYFAQAVFNFDEFYAQHGLSKLIQ